MQCDPQTTTIEEWYDRKEQRAIGHFISVARNQAAKQGKPLLEIIEKLQKKHGCYD